MLSGRGVRGGDGERVEWLFLSLGSGAEFTSSVVPDVADRQIEDLRHGVFGGEMPPGFGDLVELVVQRLYGVGRVNDFADGGVEGQERTEAFPVVSPQINDRRYCPPHSVSKSSRARAAASMVAAR